VDTDSEVVEGGDVVPLLMLEAAPLPSPEKSLNEYSYSKSVEVGRERTKHALREDVGEGGGLASEKADSGV
jgi:hypothetical protein